MKCSLGSSHSLEEISSLSHFIVFLYFLALIAEKDFLISPCYSLGLYIQNSGVLVPSISIYLPIYLFLSIHPSIHLLIYRYIYLSTSVCLSLPV